MCIESVEAATKEQKKQYKRWNEAMDKYGYEWDPYEVQTADGWILTVFRITGRDGISNSGKNADRPPVLAQHGGFDSATFWAESGIGGPTMPLQLVDEGFDVWMSTTRGATYSEKHIRDGEISLEEKWNFTMKEMGSLDLPAFVEKVLEVTGQPKVTLLGYSQGSGQMFYALATNQDYWAEKAERFVAVAPCIFGVPSLSYEEAIARSQTLRGFGFHNYFGNDESTVVEDVACEKGICFPLVSEPHSLRAMEYNFQLVLAERFQEPIPFEDWERGQQYSDPIYLSNIDRVPVSLVISMGDTTCPPQYPEWHYAEIQSEKYLRYEQGPHLVYSIKTGPGFINRMVQTLDTGSVHDAAVTLVGGLAMVSTLALAALI